MAYIQVSDIMATKPVSMVKKDSIYMAARLMKKYRVSSVVILTDEKDLAGILTVDDIVRQAVATKMDMDKPVTEIMTEKVISVTPDRDVRDVMDLFNEYEIRQAPVIENGKLVGFVTLKDILRFEPAMLDIAVENLRNEEENRQEIIKRMMTVDEIPEEDFF